MWRLASLVFVLGAWQADDNRARLQIRVVDAETNREMPATLSIQTSAGTLFTNSAGFREGVRSPGLFEAELPPGSTVVTARRGFDYGVSQARIDLRPGERRQLTLTLGRRSSLRSEGWVTGDSHVHMVHGEAQVPATFEDLQLAGRAEGLDYLSVAQAWSLPDPTARALSEICARNSTPDFVMRWNLETPKNYWRGDVSNCMGHGWTLGMRDRTAGGIDPIDEFGALNAHDYQREKVPTPNFESHALVHDLGGIVSYTHPARWWRGAWGGQNGFPREADKFISNLAQELPFDTIAGPTYDMIDILMRTHEREVNRLGQQLWYMLLNHGYRIAGTASSDATFDRPGGAVPGKVRTYTRIEGSFSIAKVAEAMRAGRNFVTSGPLLTFDIDGHQIGDSFRIDGPATLRVRIRAWGALRAIELVRNGEVARRIEPSADRFDLALEIEEKESAWYLARCIGENDDQVAITNPIYVERGGAKLPAPVPATVHLEAVDARTRRALTASVSVIERIGREERIQRKETCAGACTLVVPATARLRIEAEGYAPADRRIFLDTPELLNSAVNAKVDDLLDWATYERIRNRLAAIHFQIELTGLVGAPLSR